MKSRILKSLHIGIDARLAYRRGVGTYAANLVLSLAKLDRRNHYTIFNAPKALRKKARNPHFQWVDLPFPNAAYYEQALLPGVARQRGVDFLHYTDNSATAIDPIPFVVTLHDAMHTRPLSEVRPKPTFRHRLVYGYKKWAIYRSAPRARAILTVSEFSKGQLVGKMGLDSRKIFVTPEGVDRKFFKVPHRKPSKIFNILVHGAADERKNLSNILKAAKILKGQGKTFQMVIVGMDEKELKCTTYLEEVISLGIGKEVDWAGQVPPEMIPQTYAEADLFLYPSLLEGFGLPVLEAFASRVPVVTSNTTSLPEVAGDAALLVNPKDPKAIAQAVARMMASASLRKKNIRRGLKRTKLFTWEKTARRTLEVYEKMRDWI